MFDKVDAVTGPNCSAKIAIRRMTDGFVGSNSKDRMSECRTREGLAVADIFPSVLSRVQNLTKKNRQCQDRMSSTRNMGVMPMEGTRFRGSDRR